MNGCKFMIIISAMSFPLSVMYYGSQVLPIFVSILVPVGL